MKSFDEATRAAFNAGFKTGNRFDAGCDPEVFGDADYESWRTGWANPPEPDRDPIHFESRLHPTAPTGGLRTGDTWVRDGNLMVWTADRRWTRARMNMRVPPEWGAEL